jgi:hypothetical protein
MASAPKYSVTWRVNGVITSTAENLTAEQAYTEAIPGEALAPTPGNRWHVLMRQAALSRMAWLALHEEIHLAWQDPGSAGSGLDVEEISVYRISP